MLFSLESLCWNEPDTFLCCGEKNFFSNQIHIHTHNEPVSLSNGRTNKFKPISSSHTCHDSIRVNCWAQSVWLNTQQCRVCDNWFGLLCGSSSIGPQIYSFTIFAERDGKKVSCEGNSVRAALVIVIFIYHHITHSCSLTHNQLQHKTSQ